MVHGAWWHGGIQTCTWRITEWPTVQPAALPRQSLSRHNPQVLPLQCPVSSAQCPHLQRQLCAPQLRRHLADERQQARVAAAAVVRQQAAGGQLDQPRAWLARLRHASLEVSRQQPAASMQSVHRVPAWLIQSCPGPAGVRLTSRPCYCWRRVSSAARNGSDDCHDAVGMRRRFALCLLRHVAGHQRLKRLTPTMLY